MSVIAVLQRSPDTGLAIRQLFETLPQRTRRNQESSETKEFVELFEQLLKVQGNLKQLERSVRKWARASRLLGAAAIDMAATLSSLNEASTAPTDSLSERASTDKILGAVRKKIALVNVLLKERQLLIHLRYVRDRATSHTTKYEAAENVTEKSVAKLEKWQERRKTAQDDYDGLFDQLLQGIKFTLEESRRKGIFMIFGTELKAFAESQQTLFDACEKILAPAFGEESKGRRDSSFITRPSDKDLYRDNSGIKMGKRSSGGSRSKRKSSESRRASNASSKASSVDDGTSGLVAATMLPYSDSDSE
jgi:hypothetical protein